MDPVITFDKLDPKYLGEAVPRIWSVLSESDQDRITAVVMRGMSKLFKLGFKSEPTYEPREVFKAFHARTERFYTLQEKRGAGSTFAAVNDMVQRATNLPLKNGRFAYIGMHSAFSRLAWQYLKKAVAHLPAKISETRQRVQIGDANISVLNVETSDALRGAPWDGVVLDWVAEDSALYKQIVRPALADRNGWAVFIKEPQA